MKAKILLLLLSILLGSCYDQDIRKDVSIKEIKKDSKPLINFEDETIINLTSIKDSLKTHSLFKIWESSFLLENLTAPSFSKFKNYFEFCTVKDIHKNQKLIILGMGYDDNAYELYLINKNLQNLKWELKAFSRDYTRLVINEKHVKYDSLNKLVCYDIDPASFSNGDLSNGMYYKLNSDTILNVLITNSSGGEDHEIAYWKRDSCNLDISTNFNSELITLSTLIIKFAYKYEIYVLSECDIKKDNPDVFLIGNDTIDYTWNDTLNAYFPKWESLNHLDSTQFKSVTDWGQLDGFKKEFEIYCESIKRDKPKTAQFIRNAFTQ